MNSKLLLSIFLFFYLSNSTAQLPLGTEIFGKASFYGKEFYGKKTSSGEVLNREELTCAHRTLPFGTMIEVTNLQNNKWCVVRVNDRGPFVNDRIIDLNEPAVKALGMKSEGVIKVKLVLVGDNGTVYIGRPSSLVEHPSELIQQTEQPEIPLKPEPRELKKKPTKNIAKKRANRRRNR